MIFSGINRLHTRKGNVIGVRFGSQCFFTSQLSESIVVNYIPWLQNRLSFHAQMRKVGTTLGASNNPSAVTPDELAFQPFLPWRASTVLTTAITDYHEWDSSLLR